MENLSIGSATPFIFMRASLGAWQDEKAMELALPSRSSDKTPMQSPPLAKMTLSKQKPKVIEREATECLDSATLGSLICGQIHTVNLGKRQVNAFSQSSHGLLTARICGWMLVMSLGELRKSFTAVLPQRTEISQ
jgi:hypothetical protein